MADLTKACDRTDRLARDLKRLRTRWRSPGMFGEEAHGYRLNPRLSEEQVARFERRWRIRLPEDYREFLLKVGNGGAGPYYGLFKLGEMDEGFEHSPWGALVGDPAAPFPHSEKWNDLTGCPPEPEDADDEAYDRAVMRFEARYFSPHLVDGAIPICHLGCAIRHWLVVSGPEAGHIWCDDRASDGGIYPLEDERGNRVTFSAWYRKWLDDALARLGPARGVHRIPFVLMSALFSLGCLMALFHFAAAGKLPPGARAAGVVLSVILAIAVAWMVTRKRNE